MSSEWYDPGYFVSIIEDRLKMVARKEFAPMPQGDVRVTSADIEEFALGFGYRPGTSLRVGVASFVAWSRSITALVTNPM